MERERISLIGILMCVMFYPVPKIFNGQNNPNHVIKAIIFDQSTRKPLPGANVFLQSDPLVGTSSNAEGEFTLNIPITNQDSLIISFIGYEEKTVSLDYVRQSDTIYLSSEVQQLETAVITGKRIIAEEFTIKQMKQMDIYLNPISKADPILAVNSMPASTTTDESANISLRGSSPAETGIFFNDVPIYDAVRFSQLDGIGTFSIFNTSVVERMHVFPSNPPLEYGNASSGLISIQSNDQIPENDQNNISLSLANLGAQTSRSLGPKTGINVFANYQPSEALIGLNEQALDDIKDFYSADFGVHAIHRFNDSSMVKLFNYGNMEGYKYHFIHASFDGLFDMEKLRNFTILNYTKTMKSGELTVNNGASFSDEAYYYGNTNIDMQKRDLYFNVNYHHFFNKLSVKTGMSYDSR